ncbi:MAG: glycosyltransferase, partial [Microgenomates group bacterium]
YTFFIKKYYFLICCFSKKIFVLEKVFKKRLTGLKVNENKIAVVPHGVDIKFDVKENKNKPQSLLYFGFLTWYKGVDWLVENITNENKLIIAGGPSANLKQKKHYKLFLNKLIKKIKTKKNITLTGFVKESKIKNYFNNSEIVVFPYRRMISSSGPLSLVFSFEKPFILSRPLEGYFESEDFQEALKETGLKKEDFLFDLNPESFEKRLSWARKNLDKLSTFSQIMKQKRSWGKVARRYFEILTS